MGEAGRSVPFRWDLVTPDQLGSLLAGTTRPDLWFLDELVACTGKVIARSGNGDLVFVGRSLDSMFDLLGGAFDGLPAGGSRRLVRLPFSFARAAVLRGRRWRLRALTPTEVAHARHVLTDLGLNPHALARRERPVTFVDVVSGGSTFTELFGLLHDWITEERETWPVIRRKVRFVGVTIRRHTSPNTWRWHQHASWTGRLPAKSVVNVSLDYPVWSYFGDYQVKLTRSHRPDRWLATPRPEDAPKSRATPRPEDAPKSRATPRPGNAPGARATPRPGDAPEAAAAAGSEDAPGARATPGPEDGAGTDSPKRDERTRQALAEAAALVEYGRTRAGRQALARAISGEPTLSEPWLRTLATALNRP